jgi:uncharacterized protein YcbK (DUF882 family)
VQKISQHFARSEFACQCGNNCPQSQDPTVDVTLIQILEELRRHFNTPITVTSGVRCKSHNASPSVKGSVFSKHLEGKAADVILKGVTPDRVYKYLFERYPNSYGFGKYETFTHIDSRGLKGRWEVKG